MNLFSLPRNKKPVLEGDYNGYWERLGRAQLAFLIEEGLEPAHYLLDAACGSLRGGRFLIDYLAPGHYYGFDQSGEHLEAGTHFALTPEKIESKQPHLFLLELNNGPQDLGSALEFNSFDFVWAHALFDHLPPDTVEACLDNLGRIMAPGGKLYATFFLNPYGPEFSGPLFHHRSGPSLRMRKMVITFPDRDPYHHALAFFEAILKKHPSLRLDGCLDDYPHPLGLKVLRIVKAGKAAHE